MGLFTYTRAEVTTLNDAYLTFIRETSSPSHNLLQHLKPSDEKENSPQNKANKLNQSILSLNAYTNLFDKKSILGGKYVKERAKLNKEIDKHKAIIKSSYIIFKGLAIPLNKKNPNGTSQDVEEKYLNFLISARKFFHINEMVKSKKNWVIQQAANKFASSTFGANFSEIIQEIDKEIAKLQKHGYGKPQADSKPTAPYRKNIPDNSNNGFVDSKHSTPAQVHFINPVSHDDTNNASESKYESKYIPPVPEEKNPVPQRALTKLLVQTHTQDRKHITSTDVYQTQITNRNKIEKLKKIIQKREMVLQQLTHIQKILTSRDIYYCTERYIEKLLSPGKTSQPLEQIIKDFPTKLKNGIVYYKNVLEKKYNPTHQPIDQPPTPFEFLTEQFKSVLLLEHHWALKDLKQQLSGFLSFEKKLFKQENQISKKKLIEKMELEKKRLRIVSEAAEKNPRIATTELHIPEFSKLLQILNEELKAYREQLIFDDSPAKLLESQVRGLLESSLQASQRHPRYFSDPEIRDPVNRYLDHETSIFRPEQTAVLVLTSIIDNEISDRNPNNLTADQHYVATALATIRSHQARANNEKFQFHLDNIVRKFYYEPQIDHTEKKIKSKINLLTTQIKDADAEHQKNKLAEARRQQLLTTGDSYLTSEMIPIDDQALEANRIQLYDQDLACKLKLRAMNFFQQIRVRNITLPKLHALFNLEKQLLRTETLIDIKSILQRAENIVIKHSNFSCITSFGIFGKRGDTESYKVFKTYFNPIEYQLPRANSQLTLRK